LYRRKSFYVGNVTARRGVEVLRGRYPAILSDEEYADAVAGVESRKRHIGAKPTFARRTYALRGLIHCSCGRGCAATPARGAVLRLRVAVTVAPPDGLRAAVGPTSDPLAWYVGAVA